MFRRILEYAAVRRALKVPIFDLFLEWTMKTIVLVLALVFWAFALFGAAVVIRWAFVG